MTTIWFDDGLEDIFLHAYPLMRKYGKKGCIAIITGKVGKHHTVAGTRRRCMTLEQLKILRDEGWIIASHSVTHPQPDLNGKTFFDLTLEETEFEARESKRWIEENLGITPTIFVVPQHKIREEQKETILKHYKEIRSSGFVIHAVTEAPGLQEFERMLR